MMKYIGIMLCASSLLPIWLAYLIEFDDYHASMSLADKLPFLLSEFTIAVASLAALGEMPPQGGSSEPTGDKK